MVPRPILKRSSHAMTDPPWKKKFAQSHLKKADLTFFLLAWSMRPGLASTCRTDIDAAVLASKTIVCKSVQGIPRTTNAEAADHARLRCPEH